MELDQFKAIAQEKLAQFQKGFTAKELTLLISTVATVLSEQENYNNQLHDFVEQLQVEEFELFKSNIDNVSLTKSDLHLLLPKMSALFPSNVRIANYLNEIKSNDTSDSFTLRKLNMCYEEIQEKLAGIITENNRLFEFLDLEQFEIVAQIIRSAAPSRIISEKLDLIKSTIESKRRSNYVTHPIILAYILAALQFQESEEIKTQLEELARKHKQLSTFTK